MAPGGVCVFGPGRSRVRNSVDASSDTSSRTYDCRRQHGHRRVHERAWARRGSGRSSRARIERSTGPENLRAARTGGRAVGAVDPGDSGLLVPVFAWVYGEEGGDSVFSIVRIASAFAVLLVPSVALGATFPIAVRVAVASTDTTGRARGPIVWRQHRRRRDWLARRGLHAHSRPRPARHGTDRRGGQCREHRARALDRRDHSHRPGAGRAASEAARQETSSVGFSRVPRSRIPKWDGRDMALPPQCWR